jgi:polysaccharide export outer membrane protein
MLMNCPCRRTPRTRALLANVVSVLGVLVGSAVQMAPAGAQENNGVRDSDVVTDAAGPGDVIRLRIWQEPDLSGDFPVDEDGVVVLPRLGRIDVTKDSPDALERKLIQQYSRYLTHESIDVTVLRRVQILGAVQKPGVYPLDPTLTVADAVATAGGATADGQLRKVELIRRGERIPVELYTETRLADSPIRSGDQLFVPERSWLSRNAAVAGAMATGVLGLILAIAR